MLTIPSSTLNDVIVRLKLLQSTDTLQMTLIDNGVAICLRNLEALQASANKRLGILLKIQSSANFHWIARAIVSAIYNEHERLSIQIERLLAFLDDHTRPELCQDLALRKNAFAQIKQLNDLAMSTLGLEQQVVPALEICLNETLQSHTNLYQTLH